MRTQEQFSSNAQAVVTAPTRAEEERLAKLYGIKGKTILLALDSLSFPYSFPYDFMHLIYENLIKNLILHWTNEFKDLGLEPGILYCLQQFGMQLEQRRQCLAKQSPRLIVQGSVAYRATVLPSQRITIPSGLSMWDLFFCSTDSIIHATMYILCSLFNCCICAYNLNTLQQMLKTSMMVL